MEASKDSIENNPFASQIEQAKKEWEDMGKKPDTEPAPATEPAKATEPEPPAPPASKQESKTPLELKDEAISKAKAEIRQLQADMNRIKEQYDKAVAEKNETAAAIAQSKYQEQLEKSERLAYEDYFRKAELGGVKDMETFRYNASHYIPGLLANPDIGMIIDECKNPYAVQELLFSRMAKGGVRPEELCKQSTPTLRAWIFEMASELEAKPVTAPAASAPPPPPPKSVVASTQSDMAAEASINADGVPMEDLIRHVRKHGGKGIG